MLQKPTSNLQLEIMGLLPRVTALEINLAKIPGTTQLKLRLRNIKDIIII